VRRLSLSLLLVVVLAVVGAGWAIDKLFDRFDNREDYALLLARELGGQLAMAMDIQSEAGQTNQQQSTLPSSITLLDREAIPFPKELQELLDEGNALTLESEQGVTLYFAMPLLFYGVVVLLILVWLNPLIRRLQQLATAAKAFGNGELTRRIPTNPRSNLHDIETEFNSMAQRIAGLMADNKLLSSAVSHDLRTPLARLRFGIDAVSETDDLDLRTRYLDRISADVTQMEQLVEVLLEFARLDQQLQELPLAPTDLNALVNQCVASYEDTSNANISWSTFQGSAMIMANNRYVLMLLTNIVQNALSHGNGKVSISLHETDRSLDLVIEDDGKGIADADRENVLKPFIRGGAQSSSKKTATGGYGLGLAIVSRIAQWHGATITIDRSMSLGGASIGVAFRKAPKKTAT